MLLIYYFVYYYLCLNLWLGSREVFFEELGVPKCKEYYAVFTSKNSLF
jgi:hypothetical protein